jgi:uncharacterized phage-associated protein
VASPDVPLRGVPIREWGTEGGGLMAKVKVPPMAAALDVADYLIALAAADTDEPDYLSPLRLQKLLYYAQGWSLANRDRPIFGEPIEAWTHGPVVRKVYAHFASLHGDLIRSGCNGKPLSDEDKEFVGLVWDAYKEFSATALRNKTHQEESWKSAYRGPNEGQAPGIITDESLRDYFTSLQT